MAENIYKLNGNVSSILEAKNASNQIHIAPHTQASEFVQFQFYFKKIKQIQYMLLKIYG